MTTHLTRTFKELKRVRTKTQAGDKQRICDLIKKVHFDKELVEKHGLEHLRDATSLKFLQALQLAKQIIAERKILYFDRYHVDFLRVAEILGEAKRLDENLLIAAVLQTILRPRKPADEDPGYYKEIQPYLEQVRKLFGKPVENLIRDSLRLREINYIARTASPQAFVRRGALLSQTEKQRAAGYIRMAAEIVGRNKAAAYLRLAVRMFNLETNADSWDAETLKNEIKHNEIISIPLAAMYNAQHEKEWLADFNLKYTDRHAYDAITADMDRVMDVIAHAAGKQDVKSEIEQQIREALPKGLDEFCEIKFRRKSVSSFYRARQKKGANMDDSDRLGFRVIVSAPDEQPIPREAHVAPKSKDSKKKKTKTVQTPEQQACREVYKALIKRFETVPGRAKDFVAKPKDNGYQAFIDVFVFGAGRFEVQIVGEKMHNFNETNHETYKGNVPEEAMREITKRQSTTVSTLGGEMHSVGVGANAIALAATVSTHLAFSLNAEDFAGSVTLRRVDPFAPLQKEDNLLKVSLLSGDSVDFNPDFVGNYQDYPGSSLIHDARNRKAIIAACNDSQARAKLIEWDRRNPPRRVQYG
jgi:(p)ppGpp synthase/HD superfamily hydrolase